MIGHERPLAYPGTPPDIRAAEKLTAGHEKRECDSFVRVMPEPPSFMGIIDEAQEESDEYISADVEDTTLTVSE